MIKVYALNQNGKIELTLEGLQKLLEEAEAEGRRFAQPSVSYQCPLNTVTRTKTTLTSGDPLPISSITCHSVSQASKTEATATNAGTQNAGKVLSGICECFGIKSEG